MHELKELKEKLCKELKEYGTKQLTAGSLDTIDKLSHAIKNLDKIIEKEEYSGDYSSRRYSMDNSYQEIPYEKGIRYSGRRDSMGRYARDYAGDYAGDYSRDEEMIHKLYEIMDKVPDGATRMDIQKLISKMSEMN